MPVSRPLPVYAGDTPLDGLCTAELFAVAAVRLWVLPHVDPDRVHPDWRQGFARARIDAAGAAGFDTLLRLVARKALRSLDVRCLPCRRLGEDEAWLLQIVSLLQHRETVQARAILADWLPQETVGMAAGPARTFAGALAAGGLTIPLRPAGPVLFRRPVPAARLAPGSVLVH